MKLAAVLEKYKVSEQDKQFFINPEIVTDEIFDALMFVAENLSSYINVVEMKLRVEKEEEYNFYIQVVVDLPFAEYIKCWEKFIDFCSNKIKTNNIVIDFIEAID